MRAFEIQDNRLFMSRLLASGDFDHLETAKAVITTFMTFHVEGPFRPDYFDIPEEGSDAPSSFAEWKLLRPIVFSMIRGKNTPRQIRLVFRLPEELYGELGPHTFTDEIQSLYLTVTYEQNQIRCITGCSLKTFTMDKTIEHSWDDYVAAMLSRLHIPFI